MAVQDDAELAMQAITADDDHAHAHEVPSIILEPGGTGQLVVSFDEPAKLIIGCHIAGHWDAGMHGEFRVEAVA